MTQPFPMLIFRQTTIGIALLMAPAPGLAQESAGVWDSLGSILGAVGTRSAGIVRWTFPRSDLTVRVEDVTIAASLALGSWAGFGVVGGDTVVMGDLVLRTTELRGALDQLSRSGLTVTAVHNHLVGEEPRMIYVHYMGRGSALILARRVREVLDRTATPAPTATPPAAVIIDTALIHHELGIPSKANGTVAQVSVDLAPDIVRMHGEPLAHALGLLSPINLQLVTPGRYVATGDFAVAGEAVQRVLDALTRSGVLITALHSHMIGESPPVYFIHFWADGAPVEVLRALRAAVDSAR